MRAYPYITHFFRNWISLCKVVEKAAHGSGCHGVASKVNHVRYNTAETLWDGAVSDQHITGMAAVAGFRFRDTWQLLSPKKWMAS